MQYPVYNLNGDRPEELVIVYRNAWRALEDAMTTLHRTAPNARNWQTTSTPREFVLAQQEHCARLDALARLQVDMRELAKHAQKHARRVQEAHNVPPV